MDKKYTFQEVGISTTALNEISKLLCSVFASDKKFTSEFLNWQYAQNPVGKIVGYNAYYNNDLVAHYVAMPILMNLGSEEKKGLLSLNTATHPQHQGQGLFTQLANLTYDAAKTQGFEFVIGVANSKSFSGFVNKLGFKSICKLQARLGFGKIVREKKLDPNLAYRIWNQDTVNWRLKNPCNKYFISKNSVFSKTDKSMISAFLFENFTESSIHFLPKAEPKPLKLWIGNDPEINWSKSNYYPIPTFLRPSPLQLIYKELTANKFPVSVENIKFLLSDFDAY